MGRGETPKTDPLMEKRLAPDLPVWRHKLFQLVLSWLDPSSSSCGLAVLAPTPSRHQFFAVLATLRARAHTASHQRILPNTRRTTFINVTRLLPTVHFFLWLPQVHFSCSSSTAGYLVRPLSLQESAHAQYLFQGFSVFSFCWYEQFLPCPGISFTQPVPLCVSIKILKSWVCYFSAFAPC